MGLYIVTADTYDGGYGAEISLLGIYSNKIDALKRKRYLEDTHGYHIRVEKVYLDEDIEEYLGGYIE